MNNFYCKDVEDFWQNPGKVESFLGYRKHVNSCPKCRASFKNDVVCIEVTNDESLCLRIFFHQTALTMWAVCILKGFSADPKTIFGAVKEKKTMVVDGVEIFILPHYKKRRQQFVFVSSKKMSYFSVEKRLPPEAEDFLKDINESIIKIIDVIAARGSNGVSGPLK